MTLAVLAATAAAAGLAPCLFMLHRPLYALWFAAGLAILALLAPRRLTRRLTVAQYLFEFAQMVEYAAVVGLFWMGFYWALYGTGLLIHWISRGAWLAAADPVAFQISLWIAALIGLLLPIGLWKDVRQRWALSADGGSFLYPSVHKPDAKTLIGTLALFGIPMFFSFFGARSLFYVLLEFAIVALPAQFKFSDDDSSRLAVGAVGRLFEAAGYSVTLRPQIGDPELDPLLKPIDLFAEGESGSYAVGTLIGDPSSAQVDWTPASSLRAAAALYSRNPAAVRCLLILFGLAPDPGLTAFCERENVRLLTFESSALLHKAIAGLDTVNLAKLAEMFLHIEPAKGVARL